MWPRREGRAPYASVQEQLPLEEIAGDVLELRSGDARAVLEAGSVNFALKSEPEQEAILAGYRRFLNGLDYPLQVLVRVAPADIERYLGGNRGRPGGKRGAAEARARSPRLRAAPRARADAARPPLLRRRPGGAGAGLPRGPGLAGTPVADRGPGAAAA